jgi:putative transposase
MRDEFLNESLFLDLDQARQLIGTELPTKACQGPHSSLRYKTPATYAEQLTASTGANR